MADLDALFTDKHLAGLMKAFTVKIATKAPGKSLSDHETVMALALTLAARLKAEKADRLEQMEKFAKREGQVVAVLKQMTERLDRTSEGQANGAPTSKFVLDRFAEILELIKDHTEILGHTANAEMTAKAFAKQQAEYGPLLQYLPLFENLGQVLTMLQPHLEGTSAAIGRVEHHLDLTRGAAWR